MNKSAEDTLVFKEIRSPYVAPLRRSLGGPITGGQGMALLGWSVTWSTDWFKEPQKEVERTVEAIEKAKTYFGNLSKKHTNPSYKKPKLPETIKRTNESQQKEQTKFETQPYSKNDLYFTLIDTELHMADQNQFADLMKQVVDIESPISLDELTRRMVHGAGLRKAGKRIRDTISQTTALACKRGLFKKQGNFFWKTDMTVPVIRDRSQQDPALKKIENIAPEEITEAFKKVISGSFSVSRDEVSKVVMNLFGIKRLTSGSANQLNMVIDQNIKEGIFVANDDILSMPI